MPEEITKQCSRCKEVHPVNNFHKNKITKDGYHSACKKCIKIYQLKNQTRIRNQHKIYIEKNKEKIQKQRKNYNIKNSKHNKEYCKLYRLNNKIALDEYNKKYKTRNVERHREYRKQNRNKIQEKMNLYKNKRYKFDLNYKILTTCRNRIRLAIKQQKTYKNSNTKKLIGCSIDDLKSHIQKQFKEGMTWENYGFRGWHIDHILPCSSFNLTKPEEQLKCFHYTNLQPLWWRENIQKGNKI